MRTYIYRHNLRATARAWLWGLRDFTILCVALLLALVLLVRLRVALPAAGALCYGFLTIRLEDATILDFLRCCLRYFLSTQQEFFWR